MKKLLICVVCIFLSGCDEPAKLEGTINNFEIIRIDGCQYLTEYHNLTHKGNCDNPIHIHNGGNHE